MVDPGEKITYTLKREFFEEALNSLEISNEEKSKLESRLKELFDKGMILTQRIICFILEQSCDLLYLFLILVF